MALLESFPPAARAYLRHPCHRRSPHCDCGQYALLFGLGRVIDFDLVHSAKLCQPTLEYIP
jgi:hypothetical protein